jgi:hypothetical protein
MGAGGVQRSKLWVVMGEVGLFTIYNNPQLQPNPQDTPTGSLW